MGFDFMFGTFFRIFPFLFFAVFILIFPVFVGIAIKALSTWNKNNHSPILTVDAKIVAKRMQLHHSHHSSGIDHSMTGSSYTTYYITFQFESGDRLELSLSADEYGILVEGDEGKLTFQGTRYKEFKRYIEP